MAKEVVWAVAAVKDRLSIYQFWFKYNQSASYSEKLETLFKKAAELIAVFPNIGTKTTIEGVIFYVAESDRIVILRVWDSRQDPINLKL